MCAKAWSGLTKSEEVKGKLLLRDTRTISKRLYDFLGKSRTIGLVTLFLAMSVFVFPAFCEFIFIIGVALFYRGFTLNMTMPIRVPKRAHVIDYNDYKEGTNQPQISRGICFYGNEYDTNMEVWFNNPDMRTHTLIFGSTGSGKTEALISLAYNALIHGSGFIYVDGKGDNTLFARIFSMVRSVGREDDLLIVNFMTGARDIIGPQSRRLSNTLNPFANGSSGMLSQLVISLMASSGHTPDGDMWKGRAITFVEAIMRLLVYMRDQDKILLDANTIRYYFDLQRLELIVIDKIFPREDNDPVSLAHIPVVVLEALQTYLTTLPGYDKSRKGRQVSQVWEQHGFITMQLVRVFTSLADTYGHILRTNLAEVDLKDVVLNRRILIVLLPALEKSPDELAGLGKIIIASLKAIMAAGLGEEVEGSYKDLITRKPTNAETPFICILDEYGYYAVPGFAVVPAQARALGFSVIFAGQDLPAFQKASKEEAASIGANTNIKIAMKLEDPVETWEFFRKTAGEGFVFKADSFKVDPNSTIFTYKDGGSASLDRRGRITLNDLKKQRPGEAHLFFSGILVRMKFFYADPKPVKYLRLNHLLKIERPYTRQLIALEKQIDTFTELLKTGDFKFTAPEFNADIQLIAKTLQQEKHLSLIEKSVNVLLSIYNRAMQGTEEVIVEEEIRTDEIDVFAKPALSSVQERFIPKTDLARFSSALLNKANCVQQVEFVERLLGESESVAHNIANEIIRDMEMATHYPPAISIEPDVANIIQSVQELVDSFERMK